MDDDYGIDGLGNFRAEGDLLDTWVEVDEEGREVHPTRYIEEPLPHYAKAKAHGSYNIVGALLCTKDGRVHGNGIVIDVLDEDDPLNPLGELYGEDIVILTEAGNIISYHAASTSISRAYHPPEYIAKHIPQKPYHSIYTLKKEEHKHMLLGEKNDIIPYLDRG